MTTIRPTAVAGSFYPADATELHTQINAFLHQAPAAGIPPKALIVPHAGYIYSGAIAASGYARLAPLREQITRVVLLGPSHRVAFRGLAASSASAFRTPFGNIPLDSDALTALTALSTLPQLRIFDEAHRLEHSLEVQLPFLQTVLHPFTLLPLVVGDASYAEVAEVLEQLWGGPETLIVISSDLSHYHGYAAAQQMDAVTSRAIESLQPERIDHQHACGCTPLGGLLLAARAHGLQVEIVDLRNSGDTAGPRDNVVGYGAYVLH